MLLPEDQLALRALHGAPVSEATLQRAQDPVAEASWMAPPQFLEDRRAAQMRMSSEHRRDLAVPDIGERVDPCPPASVRLTLARRRRVVLVAPCAALAHPRPRRRHHLRGSLAPLTHEPPHLLIGDPSSRHQPPPPRSRRGRLTQITNRTPRLSSGGHRSCRHSLASLVEKLLVDPLGKHGYLKRQPERRRRRLVRARIKCHRMLYPPKPYGCAFQRRRPAVPGEGDHLFQVKATRSSGLSRPPFDGSVSGCAFIAAG